MKKRCFSCKQSKLLTEFYRDKTKTSGWRWECKNCVAKRSKRWAENNKEYHLSYMRNAMNKRNAYIRQEVIAQYGGKCACCGETEPVFLSIDHINGGGRKHIKSIGGNFYGWLRRNNYPRGFQVLCFNCNYGKYKNGGVCPHQSSKMKIGG